jgi:protein-S-isoprenylcysteine O-methyltransferase Ste14
MLIALYSAFCYAVFFLTFLYAVGFLGGFGVPRSVDAGGVASPTGVALAIDLGLLGLFGVQHSLMARRGFKQAWTKFVPHAAERSSYVLASSLALILLYWQWRPMPEIVWQVEAPLARNALWALYGAGLLLVLVSTFLIDHFELFGLRQAYAHVRRAPTAPARFRQPWPYRFVRHPLYVGWIVSFWATPTMTLGHLVFAIGASAYILAAIPLEERDLAHLHPEYTAYRARVPMLLPRWKRTQG